MLLNILLQQTIQQPSMINIFLQTIGLSIIQAICQAPIFLFAVYWGVKLANKREIKSNKLEIN